MLPLLESGCFSTPPARRVINVDESWLNGTRFVRRIWAPSDAPATVTDKQVAPRIALIAALDTEGRIWFALHQANTDSDIMCLFLRKLMAQLDRESPGWEENTTVLLDNAPWHTNAVMKERLARMEMSFNMSSLLIMPRSRTGSTSPSTCTMSSSEKARVTW